MGKIFWVLIPLIFGSVAVYSADTGAAFNPDLIILQLRRAVDSLMADESSSKTKSRRIIADSARIVSPKIRSVITTNTVTYEIEPLLPVDSVKLFVRHSQTLADTLGVITSPPYKAVWNAADVPDQDQIHLQFGYILYSADTLVVTSPALPHRWILERGEPKPSPKKYAIAQMTSLMEFSADCDLFKWNRIKPANINERSYFKLMLTSAKLHFIAVVRDSAVTAGDYVELHLDKRRDRAKFSGINHRSLRFGPRSGFRPFVAELNDSGFVLSDSVNQLLKEETEWQSSVTPDGYIIEAAIPLSILSDIGWTSSKIGMDVSLMNVDNPRDAAVFSSWAGTERFSRYKPSGWGTAGGGGAGAILWIFTLTIITLACLMPVVFVIHLLAGRKTERKRDDKLEALRELMPAIVRERDDDEEEEEEE